MESNEKTGKMIPQEVPNDQLPAHFRDPLLKYDCTLAAFSIVLEKSVDELIELIGHDGKEIVHPHLPAPICCRGYHIQEFVDCCERLGKALVLIERTPISTTNGGKDVYLVPFSPHVLNGTEARWAGHVFQARGVLFGQLPTGVGHALAWIGPYVVDGLGRKILLPQHPMRIKYFAKILTPPIA